MAVKNGTYFNRRQNPFTGEDDPIIVSSNNQYPPLTPRIETIGGVNMLVADLPEIPVSTQSIRIWSINGSTISSDFTEDPAGTAVPATGHFMRALYNSDRPNMIRLPSDIQGLKIGFEYYGLGQVICAEDLMNFKAKTIETTGNTAIGGDANITGDALVGGSQHLNGEFTSGGNIDIQGIVIGRGGLYTPQTMQSLKVVSGRAEINGESKCQTLIVTEDYCVKLYFTSGRFTSGSQFSFPILPQSLTDLEEFSDNNYTPGKRWKVWIELFVDAFGETNEDNAANFKHQLVWRGPLAQYVRGRRLGEIPSTIQMSGVRYGSRIVTSIMVFKNYN